MSKRIQLRRGTTAQTNAFTGAVGEVTVDTDKKTVVVHDGTTVGGHPVATRANADGTISLIKKDGTSAGTINALGIFNNTLTSTNTNQALTAAQGKVLNDQAFGVGQTLTDATSLIVLGTTYTNTESKPITIYFSITDSGGSQFADVTIDSNKIIDNFYFDGGSSSGSFCISFIVPPRSTYMLSRTGGGVVKIWRSM